MDTVEVLAVRFELVIWMSLQADEAVFESYATKGAFVDLSLLSLLKSYSRMKQTCTGTK